jgi:hypothetical protein
MPCWKKCYMNEWDINIVEDMNKVFTKFFPKDRPYLCDDNREPGTIVPRNFNRFCQKYGSISTDWREDWAYNLQSQLGYESAVG